MTSALEALEIKPDRDRVIVCPAGEIDLANASTLQETVVELLERGFGCVVIDLRGVTFLDSSGIRALILSHNRAQELGARTPVILGGPCTRRPLEITGVLDYLDIDPTG
ncbi:MAG: STAS domain-containing protein [Candidatus Dormibacteraeota bacterium]|nr:STAS domain-containing protein [Candidatus Dormibacteraeota bacterium]